MISAQMYHAFHHLVSYPAIPPAFPTFFLDKTITPVLFFSPQFTRVTIP
jgi:hypothetical protein